MKMTYDFKTLSLSFTSGVALGLFLNFPHPMIAASIAVSSAAILIALYSAHFASELLPHAALLLLGFNSGLNVGIGPQLSLLTTCMLPQKALSTLKSAIDSLCLDGSETGALATALLTGDKSLLNAQTIKEFRIAGAAHILALSGLHLGIISSILRRFLFFIGNSTAGLHIRSVILIGACLFYCLMTGASPSVVRAFLFITLAEIARLSPERSTNRLNCYCLALMIQLIISPEAITTPGFQLSYLAMLGIYTIFPVLDAWLPAGKGTLHVKKLWSLAAMSISCQLTTSPIAWILFHSFPVNFLLTNIITLPLCELFICSCIGCIALDSIGICPEIAKSLTSMAGQALCYCIHVLTLI
ncbi:MAG TPA: hypothetical protein DHU72_03650 [Rikenellaceae bacterium]|mgnify:FL=1|nr:hypothetical protein [Rikenellaceae bacterium]